MKKRLVEHVQIYVDFISCRLFLMKLPCEADFTEPKTDPSHVEACSPAVVELEPGMNCVPIPRLAGSDFHAQLHAIDRHRGHVAFCAAMTATATAARVNSRIRSRVFCRCILGLVEQSELLPAAVFRKLQCYVWAIQSHGFASIGVAAPPN